MAKLNQIVAVEKGVKNTAIKRIETVYHESQAVSLWGGRIRTYIPNDDDGEVLPSEEEFVQRRVSDMVEGMKDALVNLWDVTATKDMGNTKAFADVVVDGQVVVSNVPVPYLLFLEKQLTDLRTTINKLPTLASDHRWTYDENIGTFVSEEVQTARNVRVPTPVELSPATDKHPAQTQLIDRDTRVGTWKTQYRSGAIPVDLKNELLANVDGLLAAVKIAREEANGLVIDDVEVGNDIWDFVFSPLHTAVA